MNRKRSPIGLDGRRCLVSTRFPPELCEGKKSAAATFSLSASKKLGMPTTTLVLGGASRWGPLDCKARFWHVPSGANITMLYVLGAVWIWIAFISSLFRY